MTNHTPDLEQQVRSLQAQVGDLNTELTRERAHVAALDFEVDLYRHRYHQALLRVGAAGRAIAIANAAREYLATLDQRNSSVEDEIVPRLEHLREEAGLSLELEVNPLHVLIVELEGQLETSRRRHAEIKGERDNLAVKLETAEEHAAGGRAVLEKVLHCQDNCDACRHTISTLLDWADWRTSEGNPAPSRTTNEACPACGAVKRRETYDIGSGPELSCSQCEWCWGADGQPLHPLHPEPTDG